MKADTPVPEGFLGFDFVPCHVPKAGPPYYSCFAFATFSGDMDAMHSREGYDSDGMYDVTRNIILGNGVIFRIRKNTGLRKCFLMAATSIVRVIYFQLMSN